ncbi:MAG: VCBS repeat-containing protein, partial [Clostridiaceae bacterium]
MKFKVIFIKIKTLLLLVLIIAIFLLLIAFLGRSKSGTSVFNSNEEKGIKADLTGDGKKDLIDIKVLNEKYYIEIYAENKSFQLDNQDRNSFLGNYYTNWPLNLSLIDITRDKNPELFIQCAKDGVAIQHIYKYNGTDFNSILCENNNILGLTGLSNNKTEKIYSGNKKGDKITLDNYIMVNNKLQNFDYDYKTNCFGKDTISTLIDYIISLPNGEKNKPANIFYENVKGNDILAIGELSGLNNKYTFQDGFFKDIKSNTKGELSEIQWYLRFKGESLKSDDSISNYVIIVNL